MFIDEIESTATIRSGGFSLREAIEIVIAWCDKDPEKKIVKISWFFTLRCKHLAMALRFILGQLPED